MMSGWPRRWDSGSCTPRAITSTPEPAGKPRIMVTGWCGHEAAESAATAAVEPKTARAAAAAGIQERKNEGRMVCREIR